ncbi:calcium/sodium antiporter [Desulfogranum marinum]|uniref:calcium/sodium antiporter n=1 Tax=Desulfogranum marinum TaxID=453220 RepID=UPI001965F1E4|nr:calcium/sodium antiporter [Desulfogranum marinum]MBM9511727.1 calcium/sodium antiporter [Desulfogranum marinum]
MDQFPSLFSALAAVITGLLMLVAGGESLVHGATRLAQRLQMPAYLIGLTVVAFGTSVPELFISLTASLQGHPDIMIGNVIGSNIANVGLIMGTCALLAPLCMNLKEVWTELLIVIAASIFLIFCSGYGVFPRIVGMMFIITLTGYTYLTYANHNNGVSKDKKGQQKTSLRYVHLSIFLFILVGLGLLAFGATVFIQGAVSVARFFHVSELVIGLTLAAVGTSLPELAASIAALRQGETALLIGNIIGSNMFNLLMVLGVTGLIKPFAIEPELLRRDLPVMFAFTMIIIPILLRDGTTKRWHGVLLLCAYTGYCVSLL